MKAMKIWELVEVEKINDCIYKAEEFIKRANELKVYLETDTYCNRQGKLRSSAKRQSMELTRALTVFRDRK